MIESVSRRALGGSSGTYNVRASELARDRLKTLSANVVFLDDTEHCFHLEGFNPLDANVRLIGSSKSSRKTPTFDRSDRQGPGEKRQRPIDQLFEKNIF
ncbi:Tyrosine-protein phosphatase non-receptor type 3 [Homalodisca vitripennis]|nr:Tyrosine-protein phosphatase non-receptor type 3 [Homalodisca vitripennis]